MENFLNILIIIAAFMLVALASNQISKLFRKFKLPMITGLLITGIIAGPFILKLIPADAIPNLSFVNDLSLAFIAFAAGAELYLRELKRRFRSIAFMTLGQLIITFSLGGLAIFLMRDYVPFMQNLSIESVIAVAILAGTIFVARSPASAIAVINELRAKGPFTQTAIGVTVVKDVLVIILFAVNMTIAEALVTGVDFNLYFIILLLAELLAAFGLSYVLSKIINLTLSLSMHSILKAGLLLLSGYGVYYLSHFLRAFSFEHLPFDIYIEPLLICIIASFLVTNYSKYRPEFHKIIHETGPAVYVAFFTLTGASISLDILAQVWPIALVWFFIRLAAMMIGGLVGGTLGGDPISFNKIGWMPYVTQAGVALGLVTVVAGEFSGWGAEFSTVIIAVIVINQIVGPPLFKWSLLKVGEGRRRGDDTDIDGYRHAIIFGLENQSLALARQLHDHGWDVKIASRKASKEEASASDIEIHIISGLTKPVLDQLNVKQADAVVMLLSDGENYRISKMIVENYGKKVMVVRLNQRANFNRFHKIGALIVEPSTAIVSLLDHFVRSPVAASLLLGTDESQDTIDLEVQSPDLHGISLRDLRLPTDVIVLSVTRDDGQMLISHGYTRLRRGDVVTLVGSVESLKSVALRFKR